MGESGNTTLGLKAAEWCILNKIIICPRQTAHQSLEWWVDIEKGDPPNRKKIATSPEPYAPTEVWSKVREYQTYYYNKYKKDKDE